MKLPMFLFVMILSMHYSFAQDSMFKKQKGFTKIKGAPDTKGTPLTWTVPAEPEPEPLLDKNDKTLLGALAIAGICFWLGRKTK